MPAEADVLQLHIRSSQEDPSLFDIVSISYDTSEHGRTTNASLGDRVFGRRVAKNGQEASSDP